MHARAKIILLVVAPNHLVLEVFPCTTYVMWKRTGEVRVGQVTAEDRGRALHPRKSPQNSHGCGRQCRAGLLMQGLIHRDPLEDDRLVAKSYKLYFALEGERERLSAACIFQLGSSYFLALHQLPWIRQPPPVHAWLTLAFVAAVFFSPGAIATSISTDGQLCASICQLLVVSIFSTQSVAALSSSNRAVSFPEQP